MIFLAGMLYDAGATGLELGKNIVKINIGFFCVIKLNLSLCTLLFPLFFHKVEFSFKYVSVHDLVDWEIQKLHSD